MLAAWRRPPVTMVMSLFKSGPPPPGPHPGETRRLSRIHAAGTSTSSHAGVHSSKETPSITSSVLGCSQHQSIRSLLMTPEVWWTPL